jgi:integrase/recombinase XerD
MKRVIRKSKPEAPSAPADPLAAAIAQYLEWLATHNFSNDTVVNRRNFLATFHQWCRERGLEHPNEITRPILERYQRWMYHYRKKDGQALSFRTQHVRLQAIKSLFQWLTRQNFLLHNPASEIILPRMEHRLPKFVLTEAEAEAVLNLPDLGRPEGVRDRAILETLYSTGMRRIELANLKLYDVDADRGTVFIRQGKGKKDRLIPIGERALAWIDKYIQEARPLLRMGTEDATVFLNYLGQAFERIQLTSLVRAYVARANIGKSGGCHLFRHTLATLMLENGADVRVIQEMLGHAQLSTTEIYTRVSINLLKNVYSATHPGAHLERGPRAAAAIAEPKLRNVGAASDLLAALDVEAREEHEE